MSPSPASDPDVLWKVDQSGGKVATRDRLIRAAVTLFQRRGYYAVGIAEILVKANAPRGSLYHHFPKGKTDLAVAAVDWLEAEILGATRKGRLMGRSVGEFVAMIATGMANWLEETGWLEGSLLSVLAQEVVPHEPEISGAIARSYGRIQAALSDWLVADGLAPADAKEIAAVILAVLQGAFALARATRSRLPLEALPRHISIPLRQSAAKDQGERPGSNRP